MSYNCKLCGYFTKDNSNYHKHLKTKKHLKKIQKSPDHTLIVKNSKSCRIVPNSARKIEKTTLPVCVFCQKTFSSNSTLRRHQKNNCNQKKMEQIVKDINKQRNTEDHGLYDKIEELLNKKIKETSTTTINNYTNNTINNTHNTHNTQNNTHNTQNIVLNCYGKEDVTYITKKLLNNFIKGPNTMIPRLIRATHFHGKHPENRNIYIPNKKQNFVKVYNGCWVLQNKTEAIRDLVDKNYNILESYYDDGGKDTLLSREKHRYKRFINRFENDLEVQKKIERDCELIILNGHEKYKHKLNKKGI